MLSVSKPLLSRIGRFRSRHSSTLATEDSAVAQVLVIATQCVRSSDFSFGTVVAAKESEPALSLLETIEVVKELGEIYESMVEENVPSQISKLFELSYTRMLTVLQRASVQDVQILQLKDWWSQNVGIPV